MDEPISKSQKKREADFLQKIGVQLIELPANKIDELPLTDSLRQAILDAKTLKSHGAIRRQAQLIGKLMRATDSEAIIAAYEQIQAEGSATTTKFHEIEHWRDKLINEGKEAITAFIDDFHDVDIQQLRHLVKRAIEEKNQGRPLGAAKALFRFLRSYL